MKDSDSTTASNSNSDNNPNDTSGLPVTGIPSMASDRKSDDDGSEETMALLMPRPDQMLSKIEKLRVEMESQQAQIKAQQQRILTMEPPADQVFSKIEQLEAQLAQQEAQLNAQQQRILTMEQGLNANTSSSAHGSSSSSPTSAPTDDHEERSLAQDTFSFLVISRPCDTSMWWGMSVLLVQVLIFTLVAVNISDIDASKSQSNPLGIPANVDSAVRFTQFVAILIAVATQDDIRTAILLAYDGYKTEHFQPFVDNGAKVAVSFPKWLCAIVFRILEGGLGLIVTFFLIVRAEVVVDLLLNFTAMEFISQLDELAFFLSQQGFAGRDNQQQAELIENTTYTIKGAKSKRKYLLRIVLLLVILLFMLVGWGVVVHQQNSARYLCKVLHIQFSDDLVPALGAFGGLYDLQLPSRSLFPHQVVYVEKRSGGRAKFGYCKKLEAWTFAFDESKNIDPCDWQVKSPPTITYNLESTASLQWVVRKAAGKAPLQFFSMACYDCQNQNSEDVCGGRGVCVDNSCQCDTKSYGLRCEFEQPCLTLELDVLSGTFAGTREWSSHFEAATLPSLDGNNAASTGATTQVYDRPVYISETREGFFDIVMFTGRRWVVTESKWLALGNSSGDLADPKLRLTRYLSEFHAHFSEYEVAFISEAVDVDTPKDAATPVGIKWFKAVVHGGQKGMQASDSNRPLDAVLLCSICEDSTNPCLYDSVCTINGTCQCVTGSSGVLCQVPPLGNGRCDPFFNTAEFSYDNGDCCPQTCVSTRENTCGKGSNGFTDAGYFFCHETNYWAPNSEPVESISRRDGLSGVLVALSPSGSSLAVAEPVDNLVQVFDRDGKHWIQRSALELLAGKGEYYGLHIAMAGGSANDVSTPSHPTPLVLAVSMALDREGDGTIWIVRVFYCWAQGCQQAGSDLDAGGRVFALSDDGRLLAVRSADTRQRVDVYYRSELFNPSSFIPIPYLERINDHNMRLVLSLSSSGSTIAVASNQVSLGPDMVVQVFSTPRPWVFGARWEQQGSSIVLHDGYSTSETVSDYYELFDLQNMALSGDGMVIAIGAYFDDHNITGVQVYCWEGEDWEKRGSLLVGDMQDDKVAEYSVDLSNDGSIVVVGTNNDGAAIQSYVWNGTDYQLLGSNMNGGDSTSLSNDGSILAVGIPKFTSVYKYRTECPRNLSLFRVSFTTDEREFELVGWHLTDVGSGEERLTGGPYRGYPPFSTLGDEVCVDLKNGCFLFTIHYTANWVSPLVESPVDRLDPPVGYRIFVDGEEDLRDTSSWDKGYQEHHFGKCSGCLEGESLFRVELRQPQYKLGPVEWSLRDSFKVISAGGPFHSTYRQTDVVEHCIPALTDCATFSVTYQDSCRSPLALVPVHYAVFVDGQTLVNSTANVHCGSQARYPLGDCSPGIVVPKNPPIQCNLDNSSLVITARATYPSSFAWHIKSCSGDLILERGPYNSTDFDMVHVAEACVPSDGCLSFSLQYPGRYPQVGPGLNYSVSMAGELALVGEWDDSVAPPPVTIGNCTCPVLEEEESIFVEFLLVHSVSRAIPDSESWGCLIEGLQTEINNFYGSLLSSSSLPFIFESFDTVVQNITYLHSWRNLRLWVDFIANISFKSGDIPNGTEILEILREADYTEYIQRYVWHASDGFLPSVCWYAEDATFEAGCVFSGDQPNEDLNDGCGIQGSMQGEIWYEGNASAFFGTR
ncbi:Inherit from bactNOG: outer membrane autotransporter barrel [Seminavis robusta]|uniref:Inherit from bactNOG: outer membrane autotransporter barrel n=1 Tax=Seminavis robusta TaxID=568900 RepID=A0A9N8HVW0_9STRA|nr:Inherit from bactNOG: outer membrane autotransporter barrel [Seminavis robusta]|eukprot:Sro2066_g313270.1 Inherit from bactNOG: outer membrane autotransporter barrel (1692) ;mRNA; r:5597-10834